MRVITAVTNSYIIMVTKLAKIAHAREGTVFHRLINHMELPKDMQTSYV